MNARRDKYFSMRMGLNGIKNVWLSVRTRSLRSLRSADILKKIKILQQFVQIKNYQVTSILPTIIAILFSNTYVMEMEVAGDKPASLN